MLSTPRQIFPAKKYGCFLGTTTASCDAAAMNTVAGYYDHYVNAGNVNSGNVFYKTNNHAPHALVTDDGGPCLGFNAQWINDCGYDAAGLVARTYLRPFKPTRQRRLSSSSPGI